MVRAQEGIPLKVSGPELFTRILGQPRQTSSKVKTRELSRDLSANSNKHRKGGKMKSAMLTLT